jgi:cell division protein FtsZ
LGQVAVARSRQNFEVVNSTVMQATGTHDAVSFGSTPDYSHLDVPAVVRKRNVTVEALANSGVDRYDIPAFLRKQAD